MKSESKNQFALNLEPSVKLLRDPNERGTEAQTGLPTHGARSLNDLPNAGGGTVPAAHQAGRAGCGMAGERSARLVGNSH
jgi:hypothetical protein